MSDAPEKIWAWVDYDGNWDGTWLANSECLQPERLPDSEYIRADIHEARIEELEAKLKWQPIETAPEGDPHIRGMWVFSYRKDGTRYPAYFCANVGYIDEDGDFVSTDGDDDFGWSADDYDWWAPIPLPLPKPQLKEQDDE